MELRIHFETLLLLDMDVGSKQSGGLRELWVSPSLQHSLRISSPWISAEAKCLGTSTNTYDPKKVFLAIGHKVGGARQLRKLITPLV